MYYVCLSVCLKILNIEYNSAKTRQQLEEEKATIWKPSRSAQSRPPPAKSRYQALSPTQHNVHAASSFQRSQQTSVPPSHAASSIAAARGMLRNTKRRSSSARDLHEELQATGAAKFCPMCGTKVPGDTIVYRFCDECGHRFD